MLLAAGLFGAPAAWAGAPPQMEVLAAWGGPVNTVAFNDSDDSIAYVGAGRRVVVLDIADVSNIVELSSVDMVQAVQDVAYRDGYLYVATKSKPYRFAVIDVSDASDAHLVWTTPLGASTGTPLGINFRENRAYVHTTTNALWVYDIADPTAVAILGVAIGTIVYDVAVVGDLAYVAGGIDGGAISLKIYNLGSLDPLNPALVGSVDLQPEGLLVDPSTRLAVSGDRAYVTYMQYEADDCSLAVVDVSSPSAPVVITNAMVASTPSGSPISAIDVADGHVYLARKIGPSSSSGGWPDWESAYPGLRVFDVATVPDVPVEIATYKDHAGIHGVRVFGERAYVFDQGEGLVVLDVSDPTKPARIGNYHSPAFLGRMAKVGNLLYVTDYWNGLSILNVADPSAPVLIGVYQTPLGPSGENMGINNWGFAVQGAHAYLAAGGDGVHIINVSDPTAPRLVQKLPTIPGHWSVGLALRENRLHVAFEPENCQPWRLRTYDLAPFAKHAVMSTLELPICMAARVLATHAQPHLFVGRYFFATQTVDVSNPFVPELIYQGDEAVYDEAYDVAVDGALLVRSRHGAPHPYDHNGICFSDVSDPARPVPLAFVHCRGAAALALRNGRAYSVGDFNAVGPGSVPAGVPELPNTDGMECVVFDVTNPTKPSAIAWAPFIGLPDNNSMLVDDPYVFVTTAWAGVFAGSTGTDDEGLTILKLPMPMAEDLNGDGIVNGFDLALLLGAWGRCPKGGGACAADLDGNGIVNGFDLALLLGAWTASR